MTARRFILTDGRAVGWRLSMQPRCCASEDTMRDAIRSARSFPAKRASSVSLKGHRKDALSHFTIEDLKRLGKDHPAMTYSGQRISIRSNRKR